MSGSGGSEGYGRDRDGRLARVLIAQPLEAGAVLVRALERLGGEATLERVTAAAACAKRCRAGQIDVVVLHEALPRSAELLERLRIEGPPVIVVGAEASDEAVLAWLRRGATHCIALRSVAAELATRTLEQLARRRALAGGDLLPAGSEPLERAGENIIQNLNSALLVVDREGRISSCNPPAEEILDERAEALHGKLVWNWFRATPGEDLLLARSLRRGERFKGAETVITRADGSVVPVGISCAPIVGADASRTGAVAIFQDLTEIKQLRGQVLQTEKMASIGQLAAGVAHEINNPMGFIHANLFQLAEYVADLRRVWTRVEALQKAAAAAEPATVERAAAELAEVAEEVDVTFLLSDLAKAIRESQEGSERIRHIVQDLRDFSRQDTGERVLSDLNQCLDSTANIVWPMMKHIVELERDYADLPEVSCYPMQLKQVFMNLLVNAYQAIEERVGESGEIGTIELSTEKVDDGVVVVVRDSGKGILPEHLDRIFDPFFTTKKVGSGTGLGLSTSFGIVQRHGGTMTVESTPGRGSAFRVHLPLPGDPGEDADT